MDNSGDGNESRNKNKGDSDVYINVLDNYMFPSFMTFLACGLFVDSNDRLELFTTADIEKSKDVSRCEKRKVELKLKELEQSSDTHN